MKWKNLLFAGTRAARAEQTLLSVAFDVDIEVDLDSDAAAALIEGIGSERARPSVVPKADTTVKERRLSAA